MAEYEVNYQMKVAGGKRYEIQFYYTGNSAEEVFDHAKRPAFLTALLGLHATGSRVEAISVANLDRKGRDADTFSLFDAVSPATGVIDTFGNSVRYRRRGAAGGKANLYISGLPDAFIVFDEQGNPAPPAAFSTASQAFRAALIGSANSPGMGYSIRTLDAPTETGVTAWRQVRRMEPDTDPVGEEEVENASFTWLTTVGAHGFAIGDYVVFERRIRKRGEPMEKPIRSLKSPARIVDITETTFMIQHEYLHREDFFVPQALRVRKATYTLDVIESLTFVNYATRDRQRK